MNQRQFILDTLLPYKLDRSICAIDGDGICVYLDAITGNKCAVGQYMIDGPWQQYPGDVRMLAAKYKLHNILTKEVKAQKIPLKVWESIQSYHDSLASEVTFGIETAIKNLETILGIKLPELYI